MEFDLLRLALISDPHLCEKPSRISVIDRIGRRVRLGIDILPKLTPTVEKKLKWVDWVKPTSYDKRPLTATADFIEEYSNGIDAILILGDIATTGLEVDLEVAKTTFGQKTGSRFLGADLFPRFANLGINTIIVPGNHDRYQDDQATPGGLHFDEYFKNQYNPVIGVETTLVPSKDRQHNIVVITADFCLPVDTEPLEGAMVKFFTNYGHGRVADDVISQLDVQTRKSRKSNPDIPVFWAIHFSPMDGVPSNLQLKEKKKVIDLAKKLNVNHIFCGHTHERRREIGGAPQIYCAGSMSAYECEFGHYIHLLSYDPEKSEIKLTDFRYDKSEDKFVLDQPSKAA